MLCDGEELHVGEALVHGVRRQLLRQLAIVQAGAPGAEMDLVDGHGASQRIGGLPVGHPCAIAPVVGAGVDNRAGGWGHLGRECHRIRLVSPHAVATEDGELIDRPIAYVGNEEFPDPRVAQAPHGMRTPIPVIEAARDPRTEGAGCPHGKGHPRDVAKGTGVGVHMRAQHPPQFLMASLADEMQIKFAQGGEEAIGVVTGDDLTGVGHIQPVVGHRVRGEDADPHPPMLVGQGKGHRVGEDRDVVRVGPQDPDGHTRCAEVGTKDGVGIGVGAVDEVIKICGGNLDRLDRPGGFGGLALRLRTHDRVTSQFMLASPQRCGRRCRRGPVGRRCFDPR